MHTVSRLYKAFAPEHYNLKLDITHSAKRIFRGSVNIIGSVVEPSTAIRLHAKGLEITAARLDGKPVTVKTQEDDELLLQATADIAIGKHSLELEFSGTITDAMHGIYPCYFEHNGTKKELIATQCESHYAREVFPCIDEPEAKATFDLELVTAPALTVLGNMPVRGQQEHGASLVTTFETSPRMSTYLLAFVAGELIHKEAKTKDDVLVRTFATPAQKPESLDFALDVAVRTIEFFNEYFDTPYPLPKSDHVALPDFSAGAMENWGLITYRETCLLVDPENTSIPAKEFVALVVAHELSHQWFGNLVTMRWWDDLWLNESFANLMEYVAIDKLFPDWNIWMSFATSDTLSAQRRDSLPGVQAVRTGVKHPDEISTLFDPSIVYAKGAKLLKMLYHYIGEEAFRSGLKHYFSEHAYQNTEGADLWSALGKAGKVELNDFMTSWLDRPGYPLVSITQQAGTIRLQQRRFLALPDETTTDTKPWPVPLAASTALPPLRESTMEVPAINDEVIKLNMGDQSFFVSRYETAEQRQALKDKVKHGGFETIDRLQLLNESLLLARAGEGSLLDTFHLLEAYDHEASEPVWDIISMVIADSRRLIEDDEASLTHLKAFVRRLVDPQYQRLGWEKQANETSEETKLRSTIIGLAAWSEHEAALSEALRRFNAFKEPDELPADLRTIIYSAGVKHDGMAAFEKLLQLHSTSNSAEERTNLCLGMTSSRDKKVIARMLDFIEDQQIVRQQDVDHWFVYLIRNVTAKQQAWEWLTSEWSWIEKTFGSDKSYDKFVRYSAGALTGEKWQKAFDDFFEPKKSETALTRAITIGSNDIAMKTAWQKRDGEELSQYLAANQSQ